MMDSPSDKGEASQPTPQSLNGFNLEQFAPYLMNRIMGRYNASLQQQLAKAGLSTAKMRALAVLAARDGLTVNELSVHCVIEQSTMSRTLTAMLDEGLIRREEDEHDSRARRIHLTEQGRDLFNKMRPYLNDATEQLFVGIDLDEREAFVSSLTRILNNIRRHPV